MLFLMGAGLLISPNTVSNGCRSLNEISRPGKARFIYIAHFIDRTAQCTLQKNTKNKD